MGSSCADSLVGNAKNLAGKVLGDKELEAKGYAQATGDSFAQSTIIYILLKKVLAMYS